MKYSIGFVSFILLCASPSYADKKVNVSEVPRILTYGVDARDYDEISSDLSSSILTDKRLELGADKILALGPIDDDESVFFFDRVTLQEKLQTQLQRSGMLSVTFADVEIQSASAMDARTNIRQREYDKSQINDDEAFTLIGELPEVDYILFGRRSSQTGISGKTTEITHRFNWKIGDVRTGLIVWTDEKTISKSGEKLSKKELPDWVQQPRLDSPTYRYALGQSSGADSITDAIKQAEEEARKALMTRLGLPAELFKEVGGLEVVPFGQHPMEWNKGDRIHCLFRQSVEESQKIVQAVELGKEMAQELSRAKAFLAGKELTAATKSINAILDAYPNTLLPGFTLAEAQLVAGDLAKESTEYAEARKWYAMAEAGGALEAAERLLSLPAASKLSSLHSRWNGQKVAIFCAKSKDGSIQRSKEISLDFYKEYKAAGLAVADVYNKLSDDERVEWIEFEDAASCLARAKQAGAGILFSLVINTQSGSGETKIITLPNGITYESPAMDTQCKYDVIQISSGQVLLSNTIEESASDGLEGRITALVMQSLVNDSAQAE